MTNNGKNRLFTRAHIFPLASASLGMALLIGGVTYAYAGNRKDQEILRQVQLPSDLSGIKSIDEIRALAGAGSTEISGIELEQEDGSLVYKVKFSDGTFKLYDARTGEMLSKSDLEVDASVPADFVAGVSIDRAREIAQAVFATKTITKIELETENAVVVYSVRFSDDSRVDVSAVDGTVVRTRDEASGERTGSDDSSSDDQTDDSEDNSGDDSNKDSDDSKDSEDHQEEDTEDDGDRSGSDRSGSGN